MNRQRPIFFIVAAIIAAVTYIAFNGLDWGSFYLAGADQMRYGIDIRGGVEAVYMANDYQPDEKELDAARKVLETRLDAKNIVDREVTIIKANSSILVRFPWKSDDKTLNPQAAISELGEMAKLTFRDPDGNVVVEGQNVKNASPEIQRQQSGGGNYVVALEFDAKGTTDFAEATTRLKGQAISIYMDETLISSPTVQNAITEGKAVITGNFDSKSAKDLADKINSGSLPFSMVTSSNGIISPTLGKAALNTMVRAGILSFILLCLFMLIYYRLPGFTACIALVFQLAGQLLALSVPQFSLTLPGVAAIVLSVGMSLDANIIISERIKEEINSGKTLTYAIEAGFRRAFTAVFDGNITTIIVAIIIMMLGSGSLYSFGYSLITGVIMNFIAGVASTRLMIKSLSYYKPLRNPALYGARRAAK